jgi:hypothetical protein
MSTSLTTVKSLVSTLSFTEKMDLIGFVSKTAALDTDMGSVTQASTKAVQGSAKKAKAPRSKKPRDPEAPRPAWLVFGEKVRETISNTLPQGAKIPGPVWMQTAAALRAAGLMETATADQILSAYNERIAHPPPKKAVAEKKVVEEKKVVA